MLGEGRRQKEAKERESAGMGGLGFRSFRDGGCGRVKRDRDRWREGRGQGRGTREGRGLNPKALTCCLASNG